MSNLIIGKKYRLNLPEWERNPGSYPWHERIVILKRFYKKMCDCNMCYECNIVFQIGQRTAWVTAENLPGIFKAQPEWLGPANKIICNCSLDIVMSRGCKFPKIHI